MNPPSRVDRIDRKISRLFHIVQKEESRLSLLSTFRILSFLGFLGWILGAYLLRTGSELHYLPAIPILLVFYRLLALYQRRKEKVRRLQVWVEFLKTQKARILLEGSGYPRPKREYYKNLLLQNNTPSWTKDLDFLGEKGVYSRIDTTILEKGTSSFLNYFFEESSEERIRSRQKTVIELSERPQVSQKLLRQLRLYEASFPDRKDGEEEKLPSYIPDLSGKFRVKAGDNFQAPPFNLFEKIPSGFWDVAFGALGKTIRIIFPVWILGIWIFLIGSLLFAQTWGAGLLLLNFAFFGFYREVSLSMIHPIAEDSETLEELGKILFFIRNSEISGISREKYLSGWTEKELKTAWKELDKIAGLAAYTRSPLSHGLLNILFFFDLWVWSRYAKWWKSWGERILPALEDLSELDSLLPFANLKWIEPTFSFPILEKRDGSYDISARALVHPLIPLEKRVPNDLESILPGKLLLLTGSNMSGKTTYLRAVGICGVLAMAGGPVPAQSFRTPIIDVHSSIRNEDSVEEGVSFFYAEVRRLGRILKEVTDFEKGHLVLLDEILKGTNSRERTIACKGILKKLTGFRVFGIVTTHDLELAGLQDLALYHFREEIREGKMTFDYKIREGVVRSSNALEVLKLEGLDLE